jgi:hypothetical protein
MYNGRGAIPLGGDSLHRCGPLIRESFASRRFPQGTLGWQPFSAL